MSSAAVEGLHPLWKAGACQWPSCGSTLESYPRFLEHLHSAHDFGPLALHQVRIKGLVVSQLRAQVAEEEAVLDAMLAHVRASKDAQDHPRLLLSALPDPPPSQPQDPARKTSLPSSLAQPMAQVRRLSQPEAGAQRRESDCRSSSSGESRRSSGALTLGSAGEDDKDELSLSAHSRHVITVKVEAGSPVHLQPIPEEEGRQGPMESPTKSDPEDYATHRALSVEPAELERPASLVALHPVLFSPAAALAQSLAASAEAHTASADKPTEAGASGMGVGTSVGGAASRQRGTIAEDLALNRPMYKKTVVRPPHSYATLIRQAIIESKHQQRTLQDIYQWFVENFAWFRAETTQQWKNAIRHNLSLQRCFKRTNDVKGSYWVIDHDEQGIKKRKRKSAAEVRQSMGLRLGVGLGGEAGQGVGFRRTSHPCAFPLPLVPARRSVGLPLLGAGAERGLGGSGASLPTIPGLPRQPWRNASLADVADSLFPALLTHSLPPLPNLPALPQPHLPDPQHTQAGPHRIL